MQSIAPKRFEWGNLTFSWSDVKITLQLSNKSQDLVFVKCTERPDVKFVQLAKEGGYAGAIMLWEDLYARTLGNNVKQVLDADRAAKTPTCTLWLDPRGRCTSDIFKPAQLKMGNPNWYANAWWTALADAAAFSIKETTADIAKKGKFDVKGRYFTPSGTSTYRLFFVPHAAWLTYDVFTKLLQDTLKSSKGAKGISCTVAMPGINLTTAQLEGRESLDANGVQAWSEKLGSLVEAGDWLEQVADQKSSLLRIGMHPLGLYSTWIAANQVNDLIKEVTKSTSRTASWRRIMPNANQVMSYNETLGANGVLGRDRFTHVRAEQLPLKPGQDDLAEPRRPTDSFMGDSANNWATTKLGWPEQADLTCHPAEWLHREAHNLVQKVADRFSNIIFGTSECNTHMMRAEATIRDLLNKPDKVAEVCLVTMPVDENVYMVDNVKANGQVDGILLQNCPWKQLNGPDYWWITLQLDYTIQYQSKISNDVLKYTTHFQPFSRYRPFFFEVDLDAAVNKQYFQQKPFTGAASPNWHQTLNTQYLLDEEKSEAHSYHDSEEDIPMTKPKKKEGLSDMALESDHDSGGELDEDLVKQGTSTRQGSVAKNPQFIFRKSPFK